MTGNDLSGDKRFAETGKRVSPEMIQGRNKLKETEFHLLLVVLALVNKLCSIAYATNITTQELRRADKLTYQSLEC